VDATVLLTVLEKLRGIFAEQGTYLACTQTPTVFGRDKLETVGKGSSTAEELAFESAWIRSVNFIPTAGVLLPNELTYLWDGLAELKMQQVVIADGSASGPAADQIKAAEKLLYEDPSAEIRSFTVVHKAYLALQDIHKEAVQIYRQRQLEALQSTEQAVRDFWTETAEPSYRAEIAAALFRWEEEGHKSEIESAKRVLVEAAESKPAAQWTRWMSQFASEIDTVSDLSLIKFAPTSFSPPGITAQSDWADATVDGSQYEQLVGNAPQDLKQRLYSADPGYVSVRFEFARLNVERAWFPRGAFESRIWKTSGDSPMFSDGGDPPKGKLPGYVTAVILVRNIQVRKLAPPPHPSPPPKPFRRWPFLRAAGIFNVGGPIAQPAPAEQPIAMPIIAMARVHELPTVDPMEIHLAVAERKAVPMRIERNFDALNTIRQRDHALQQLMIQKVVPTIVAAQLPTVTEQAIGGDDVCVLAFLWKGFGTSPNPDPALMWPNT
jgi:hypothetical protein